MWSGNVIWAPATDNRTSFLLNPVFHYCYCCSRKYPLSCIEKYLRLAAHRNITQRFFQNTANGKSEGSKTHSDASTILYIPHTWAHRCLWLASVAVTDIKEKTSSRELMVNFASIAPNHGWLGCHRGSNSQSANNRPNAFLSRLSGTIWKH